MNEWQFDCLTDPAIQKYSLIAKLRETTLAKFSFEVDGSEATEVMALLAELVQGLRQVEDLQEQNERIERAHKDNHKLMEKLCNS